MHADLSSWSPAALLADVPGWLYMSWLVLKVIIGFSVIIVVHELGHFIAAKAMGVRVDRFAVGFLYRLVGYRRGQGLSFGPQEFTAQQLAEKGYGETDYCLNALPIGGYVKMLGQDDIIINEETGEIKTSDDPRSFTNKPVWRRMVVVSAGVIFNMAFAILVYAAVFMSGGQRVIAPLIGSVEPGSPAAQAGLLPGDRIVAINGDEVTSFTDIQIAAALGPNSLRMTVERDGQRLPDDLVITLAAAEAGQRGLIGVAPLGTPVVALPRVDTSGFVFERELRPGDQVTHANGEALTGIDRLIHEFARSGGRPVELTIERPGTGGAPPETLTVMQRPRLVLEPNVLEDTRVSARDRSHLLGLCPRQCIDGIQQGSPATTAGFRPGDVIVTWGTVINPAFSDIVESIKANADQPIPVVVERGGKDVGLSIVPQRPFRLLGASEPRVGIAFRLEHDRPVIARVLPDTPAATLTLPDGAELLSIGDQPVGNWSELYEALCATAGTTVPLQYRHAGQTAVTPFAVPSSLVNELSLPPTARILAIDDRDEITSDSGKRFKIAGSGAAVTALLRECIGRTVTVRYAPSRLDSAPRTAPFTVRPDNVDPWQLRAGYYPEDLEFSPVEILTPPQGNPLKALAAGVGQTAGVLNQVYLILRGMLVNVVSPEQGVSAKNVAGPIGIVQMAVHQAETGLPDLLSFLAYISVNLAVLNFLPIPILDGGLMVFLLLERLRGKPLSIKTQVATTLTALGLIALVFLLVTIQDISRIFGWA